MKLSQVVAFILMIASTWSAEAVLFDTMDNRVRVNSGNYPFRVVGRILTSQGGRCTGYLTGPNKVRTVKHCLRDIHTKEFLNEVTFQLFIPNRPDLNGPHTVKVHLKGKFEEHGTFSQIYYEDVELTLSSNIGDQVGYLGTRGYDDFSIIDSYQGQIPDSDPRSETIDFCTDTFKYTPIGLNEFHSQKWPSALLKTGQPDWVDEFKIPSLQICAANVPYDAKHGFPDNEVVAEKCLIAGMERNSPVHNCSLNGGGSGGVLFFYDPDYNGGSYFAFASHVGAVIINPPEGEPFSKENFNVGTLLVPDWIDPPNPDHYE